MIVTNPFSDINIKYIPTFLLHMINDQFFLRHTEKIYELQHTSFAIPPSIYNFRCYSHLERMRESYVFIVYFVIADSLFYLIPVIVSTFSLVRFFQELQKSLNFQRQSVSGKSGNLWTLPRLVLALDCFFLLLSLLAIVCFAVYWLVVDPESVFLFESAHYLNIFTIMVVSFYILMRNLGFIARMLLTLYNFYVS